MLSNVFAFANQKGGVGKTTTCVNLAAALVLQKYRVLLLDMDPQGNATTGSGVDKNSLKVTMNDLLLLEASFEEAVQSKTPAGYGLIGANSDLTAAEVSLVKQTDSQKRLAEILKVAHQKYDWILIDCPPSLSMLTINAMVAARWVIIPMQCEYFAMEGLSSLVNTIRQIQSSINPSLDIGGIVRTMFDNRNRLATEVSDQLLEHFGDKVFKTVVPRNVRLAEAPNHGLPVLLYDRQSRGSVAYSTLASELTKRFEKTPAVQKVKQKGEIRTHG